MALGDARTELRKLIFAYRASQCVHTAAVLGIADRLADGWRTASELAELTATEAGALERLLRALADLGVLQSSGDGRFGLTPLGELLKGNTEGTLRAETLFAGSPPCWMPWGQLLESVRSGKASFPGVMGCDAWEYRARHPEARALFDAMAVERTRAEEEAIIQRLALPSRGLVVDVGGGTGGLLARILREQPGLLGVLFDRPQVAEAAGRLLAEAGAAERCRIVGGDFFRDVPPGGDLYVLRAVVHDWDDAAALRILGNCRRAMPSGARLVIIEKPADAAGQPLNEMQDLHMLVIHGGRERTVSELGALLCSAGFRCSDIRTAGEGTCLIEGVPV